VCRSLQEVQLLEQELQRKVGRRTCRRGVALRAHRHAQRSPTSRLCWIAAGAVVARVAEPPAGLCSRADPGARCCRAQDQLIQRCLGKVQEWETGTNTLEANHKKHLWISPGQPGQ
jgi:hypothetical protein